MTTQRSGVRRPRAAGARRSTFCADTGSGTLGGWVVGEGPRVLALHGGPGLSYGYLDDVVSELAADFRVATFQQRGLAPSETQGEFTVAEAVADVVAVLDALEWDSAYLVGHSWGGHLALHAAVAVPERLAGVLSVDPLGAVGDGGAAAFAAEMAARLPESSRARAQELDEKDTAGTATPEESREALALVWPSYYADPAAAPPMPALELSEEANLGLWGDLQARLPGLEASLATIRVPVGLLVGERSPIPCEVGVDTAARIPGGWAHVEPGAGHFVWHEAPGSVAAAVGRLVAQA